MAVILGLSVISYFFGNKDLLLLWSFFSCQQLIVHLALIDLNMPANLFHTFAKCSQILRYDVFSVDDVSKALVINSGEDGSPFNSNFAAFGYNSRYFIINMDLPFYLYLAYPFILLTLLGIVLLGRNSPR